MTRRWMFLIHLLWPGCLSAPAFTQVPSTHLSAQQGVLGSPRILELGERLARICSDNIPVIGVYVGRFVMWVAMILSDLRDWAPLLVIPMLLIGLFLLYRLAVPKDDGDSRFLG